MKSDFNSCFILFSVVRERARHFVEMIATNSADSICSCDGWYLSNRYCVNKFISDFFYLRILAAPPGLTLDALIP